MDEVCAVLLAFADERKADGRVRRTQQLQEASEMLLVLLGERAQVLGIHVVVELVLDVKHALQEPSLDAREPEYDVAPSAERAPFVPVAKAGKDPRKHLLGSVFL